MNVIASYLGSHIISKRLRNVGHDGKMSGFCYDMETSHDVELNISPRPTYSVDKYKIYMGIK